MSLFDYFDQQYKVPNQFSKADILVLMNDHIAEENSKRKWHTFSRGANISCVVRDEMVFMLYGANFQTAYRGTGFASITIQELSNASELQIMIKPISDWLRLRYYLIIGVIAVIAALPVIFQETFWAWLFSFVFLVFAAGLLVWNFIYRRRILKNYVDKLLNKTGIVNNRNVTA